MLFALFTCLQSSYGRGRNNEKDEEEKQEIFPALQRNKPDGRTAGDMTIKSRIDSQVDSHEN